MSGGGEAPAAPNYQPIAQADENAAKIQAQTSTEQLDWAKQQYADQAPRTAAYVDAMTKSTTEQSANARTDRARYQDIYQPTEDKFVDQANHWNDPGRADQMAGAAESDVSSAMDKARANATSSLESFGIDPSQTRYSALDLGTRVQQAAGQAAAGTQSRLNSQATGLALQGEAINIGKGYPGQVGASYAGATQAGGSGVTSALNTSSTYGNLMGTGTQWAGLANNSNAGAVGALNTGFGNELDSAKLNNEISQNTSRGIGSMVGGALSIAALGM